MNEVLSQADLESGFGYEVWPYLTNRAAGVPVGSANPTFVAVGGQPGAGKTKLLETTVAHIPGAVLISGDELRQFHPDYDELMSTDPLRMPQVTAQAAGAWVEMSLERAKELGFSAVSETTLRSWQKLTEQMAAFKQAGFTTRLHVLVVPEMVSRLGTLSRYITQMQDKGAGRWTPGVHHDGVAKIVPQAVQNLAGSGQVDHVLVVNRAGRVFFDQALHAGDTAQLGALGTAVQAARDVASLSPAAARQWVTTLADSLAGVEKYRVTDKDVLSVARRLVSTDSKPILARPLNGDPQFIELLDQARRCFEIYTQKVAGLEVVGPGQSRPQGRADVRNLLTQKVAQKQANQKRGITPPSKDKDRKL